MRPSSEGRIITANAVTRRDNRRENIPVTNGVFARKMTRQKN